MPIARSRTVHSEEARSQSGVNARSGTWARDGRVSSISQPVPRPEGAEATRVKVTLRTRLGTLGPMAIAEEKGPEEAVVVGPDASDVQPTANETLDRTLTGLVTVLPFIALGFVAWQLWETALHWHDVVVFLIMYVPLTL